jgi:hypothetical protein
MVEAVQTSETLVRIALMMEVVQTSETSVNSYQSTRCYSSEDSHLLVLAFWNVTYLKECSYSVDCLSVLILFFNILLNLAMKRIV